jgi:hypothetical protein
MVVRVLQVGKLCNESSDGIRDSGTICSSNVSPYSWTSTWTEVYEIKQNQVGPFNIRNLE